MYYRYTKSGLRIPVDLDGLYDGGAIFIAGGAPSLGEELNLHRLAQSGLNVLALNNTATLLESSNNLWLGGDKPRCYSKRILKDPRMLKFAVISRKNEEIDGTVWRDMPSTLFFGTCDKFNEQNFLMPHRDFVWWKNTFYIALQLVYRLGFRKVYLVGCSFRISSEKQYSYDAKLTGPETEWNQRVYEKTVGKMKRLKPAFEAGGLEVISATPDSLLNDDFETIAFDDAIDDALENFPAEYRLEDCVHSSALKKPKE